MNAVRQIDVAIETMARAAVGRRDRRSPASRIFLGLFALLALALAIVAVVLITAPAPTRVMLRKVVYSDVQKTSAELKQLVLDNTK